MKRYALLAIPAALLIGGVALAWTPTETAKCGTDGTTYTVTLATEDDSPATYTITTGGHELASGSYVNGQVVSVTSPDAITVTEVQGNATETDTYQPLVCAKPTPKATPKATPPATTTLAETGVIKDDPFWMTVLVYVGALASFVGIGFRFLRGLRSWKR